MRRGFTLIELLVVIAIIAILAAILFPVFARAREKARQSNCLSNFKQIMLAIRTYTSDYDEKVCGIKTNAPAGWATPSGDTATPGWMPWFVQIDPYMKNTQILNCPSLSTAWAGDASFNVVSYGMNEKDLDKVFSEFGRVSSTRIIKNRRNGRSKGFGFVRMSSQSESKAAVRGLHGEEVEGRRLVVKEAQSSERL